MFSELTHRALRRGVFRSAGDFVPAIERHIAHANHDSQPLAWTASAASITAKLKMQHPNESGQ